MDLIIYKVINLINNKCYIGKTTSSLNKRRCEHICCAKGNDYNSLLHKAIRKYGKEKFQWEILKECDDELVLNLMETFMIMVHKSHMSENGYNMTWGGEGFVKGHKTNLGHKHTEETKELCRLKAKLRPKIKEETRKKLSRSLLGRVRSNESKIKQSITTSLWYECIDPYGNKHIVHGLKDICQKYNLSRSKMNGVSNKLRKTHKNWICNKI